MSLSDTEVLHLCFGGRGQMWIRDSSVATVRAEYRLGQWCSSSTIRADGFEGRQLGLLQQARGYTMRHNVPSFRQITGNPTWSDLTVTQARRLMARAKSQVRHGTGITHGTMAVLEALVWRYRHKISGVCMASMATIAEAAKVSTCLLYTSSSPPD